MKERALTAADSVLSCAAAGEFLGMSRQAVHKGVDEGRVPGFRDPITGRVWVEREWVELNAPGGLRLLARVEALETAYSKARFETPGGPGAGAARQIADLEKQLADLRSENTVLRSENLNLREDKTTTKAQNL